MTIDLLTDDGDFTPEFVAALVCHKQRLAR
jgi:hypothetical protein